MGTRKGVASSTTMQKATDAVIDDACTVFDDGAVLLFSELSSWSLTTRVASGRERVRAKEPARERERREREEREKGEREERDEERERERGREREREKRE